MRNCSARPPTAAHERRFECKLSKQASSNHTGKEGVSVGGDMARAGRPQTFGPLTFSQAAATSAVLQPQTSRCGASARTSFSACPRTSRGVDTGGAQGRHRSWRALGRRLCPQSTNADQVVVRPHLPRGPNGNKKCSPYPQFVGTQYRLPTNRGTSTRTVVKVGHVYENSVLSNGYWSN